MSNYSIGRLNGECVLVFYDAAGKRRRYRLGTKNPREAAIAAPAVYAELTRPTGKTVKELWQAFTQDKAGRAITTTMVHTWKALRERFSDMPGDAITVADCDAHVKERREDDIQDGTLRTELGHLRMVLNWAVKEGHLAKASHIKRPAAPNPKGDYLTRKQARALIDAADFAHVRLYIVLALGTGARNAALLGLTWDRCDFDRDLIHLRDPMMQTPRKGRAVTPMNRPLKAALLELKTGALSEYVIEWAGKKVASVKRGLKAAAKRAGINHISPHVLRHTAGVHMAEAGIPMEEIAQYLGHKDVNTTRRVYAQFSPDYLKGAASALEYDDLAATTRVKKA